MYLYHHSITIIMNERRYTRVHFCVLRTPGFAIFQKAAILCAYNIKYIQLNYFENKECAKII